MLIRPKKSDLGCYLLGSLLLIIHLRGNAGFEIRGSPLHVACTLVNALCTSIIVLKLVQVSSKILSSTKNKYF